MVTSRILLRSFRRCWNSGSRARTSFPQFATAARSPWRSASATSSSTASSLSGHGNRCFSSRLLHRQNPFRSQYSAFIKFLRRLQNRYNDPLNGSHASCCSTSTVNPADCFLMSVLPGRMKIRVCDQSINITRSRVAARLLVAVRKSNLGSHQAGCRS